MKLTKIEWCQHTWNPIRGCTKISAGCDHCYAAAMSKRNPATLGVWGPEGARSFGVESYWRQPAKWNAEAKALGEVHSVFCASLADLFEGAHEQDESGEWTELREGPRPDYLPVLERMVETFASLRNLRVLALTKRPWNALRWADARGVWPASWWLGTSVENQAAADERIPWLLQVPSRRFLSCEPLLGAVDLSEFMGALKPGNKWAECLCDEIDPSDRPCLVCGGGGGIHWVIAGGESGAGARPMHPAWVRSLRDQCEGAGVPFFFKQWGEWVPYPGGPIGGYGQQDLSGAHRLGTWTASIGGTKVPIRGFHRFPAGKPVQMLRIGKHHAGRALDGRTWDQFPGQSET